MNNFKRLVLNEVKRVTYYYCALIHTLEEPRFELGDKVGKEVEIDVVEAFEVGIADIFLDKLYITHTH